MKNKVKIISAVVIAIISVFFIFYSPTDPAISVSVSTDGRYVVSGHVRREADPSYPIGQLVLWDIEKKTNYL